MCGRLCYFNELDSKGGPCREYMTITSRRCPLQTPAHIRSTLHLCLKEMENDIGNFVKRPGKDFTRHRISSFSDTILTIMTMEAHSLNRELFEYYSAQKRTPLTKSAFVQNRGKLSPNALPYLLKSFNSKHPFLKQYKGLHLLACDGTDSNIPADEDDTASLIPFNSNNGGYYQFHTVVMFDLLEKRYSDAVIQPRRELCEADACCSMVDRNPVPGQCLFICDRGFMSFNVLAHIVESGNFFLIRVKDIDQNTSPFKFCDLPSDAEGETACDFVLSRKRSLLAKQSPQRHKVIPSSRKFDFIPPKDKMSVYSLSFRLVKLALPNGSFEYIVTNLPEHDFPLSEIGKLYRMRWGIEVSFRFLKYNMALNYFHSVKREFLSQEIFAKLILFNFVSLLMSCVQPDNRNTKFSYQISFSDAIYKGRCFLLRLIPENVLLDFLIRDLTPLRPDRIFKRKMRSQCLKSLQNRT